MGKKLYVGNLGAQADGTMLKTLFSVFGTVEQAYIIPDKATGQCKGYGFVVMSSDAEAQAGVCSWNCVNGLNDFTSRLPL